jgi:Flp pilus assembly protein TadB
MSIRKEQDRNESVSGLLAKVRNSATFLERQLEQVRQQKQRLQVYMCSKGKGTHWHHISNTLATQAGSRSSASRYVWVCLCPCLCLCACVSVSVCLCLCLSCVCVYR